MPTRICVSPGDKYGRLTVLCGDSPYINPTTGKPARKFKCLCECGRVTSAVFRDLRSGHTQSCGCLKRTTGIASIRVRAPFQSWTVDGEVARIDVKGSKIVIDAEDVEKVNCYRWFLEKGYAVSGSGTRKVYLHRLMLGLTRESCFQVDHVNRNRADNRKGNLRVATNQQNNFNKGKHKDSPHKHKCCYPRNGKYYAQIYVGGKSHYLGSFATEDAAAAAYDAAAARLHGEYACFNLAGGFVK